MHRNNKTLKVVVGILRNAKGEILIAKRRRGQFMSGYWELPGGKIEDFETKEQSIKRELNEELGIEVKQLSHKHTMCYDYPDKTVQLWIYNIDSYTKEPTGQEGQNIHWCKIDSLDNFDLLPTMGAIIHKIILPEYYWITLSSNHQSCQWMAAFDKKLTDNIKLIQLRSKVNLDADFINKIYNTCQQNKVKLLLNTIDKRFDETDCDGWHLSTAQLMSLHKRPCARNKLLGASTHNLAEALKAQAIDVDFIVISPVKATKTHPDAMPIGWETARKVADTINIPVYFLGGMGADDLTKALELGAQGIAGVSTF